MFGLDLGKMLSGEGGGLGGMLGGSMLGMVKKQLSNESTRKMITAKIVEMASHLASTFTSDDKDIIKKDYESSANEMKNAYSKRANEILKGIGENPTEEEKQKAENLVKEMYEATQKEINELYKKTETKIKEATITKNDISILSLLKPVHVKNEKNQIVLIEDGNGTMIEKMEDAIFIEIKVKGVTRKTLQLDEFLATMLEQVGSD